MRPVEITQKIDEKLREKRTKLDELKDAVNSETSLKLKLLLVILN